MTPDWTAPAKWRLDTQRDDDGDRYIWDHYAVNVETGERRPLSISSNQRAVSRMEFDLHCAFGFPSLRDFPERIRPGIHRPIYDDDWKALIMYLLEDRK